VGLAVCDAGPGFDADSEARLFEMFYTTKSRGLGIGLAVSRSIIERHHGRLWAERTAGGATFRFVLPCARAGAS
jgi:signal transduction histidine kinase